MEIHDQKYGFLGAGKMLTGIAKGLINARFLNSKDVIFSTQSDTSRDSFIEAVPELRGAKWVRNIHNATLVKECDVIILGVKPEQLEGVLSQISVDKENQGKLFISVAAGITPSWIEEKLKPKIKASNPKPNVVWAMPNTPCEVNKGVTGYMMGTYARKQDGFLIKTMFGKLGDIVEVRSKDDMNKLTAISGCGPAYVFDFIDAFFKAAISTGLPEKLALQLAVQSVFGSVELLKQTGRVPAELSSGVKTAGGISADACKAFEKPSTLVEQMSGAVQTAIKRLTEFGKKYSSRLMTVTGLISEKKDQDIGDQHQEENKPRPEKDFIIL